MRFYFATSDEAWAFAQRIVLQGRTVIDYGVDADRLVDIYYIEAK